MHPHLPHLTLHEVVAATAYWTLFWSLLYAVLPPREIFNSPGYNKFLELVNYYGSLNIRNIIMKNLYQAPPTSAPPTNPTGPQAEEKKDGVQEHT